ncbi:sodium:solute symporter [Belliella kenyensis]|uniref:Sodium:solute symporter n=1 Tax=Belliella kenyensis TaxID=1472724 RepID=A0ABV8EIR8_9BACT|nr:sodium:solute symporter [Belliella kenyensis]MCH7401329.1 sodium:solute symporter [Belliella kenyensis]MDN3602773.1 sodium:solute symporter [Belliella kenyensis]
MGQGLVFGVVVVYFMLLILISYLTSRKSDHMTFYTANRQSSWILVAFGMIGASLSGVTFISVPGEVESKQWTYLQFVMGNMVGYALIATILIPLFYKMQLISIYEYLQNRFGRGAYKSGSVFFIISQTIGASFRLFLAATALQIGFFEAFGVPFFLTVLITLLLIYLYTVSSGVKTIVWTDTLQTMFLLAAVTVTIIIISRELSLGPVELAQLIGSSDMSTVFEWDILSDRNFFKMFVSGVFITIAMNGLDQNVMQKNLTCKNKAEAQKNIFWFSVSFFFSTTLFLSLGVLLYTFAEVHQLTIPSSSDEFYPLLALNNLGTLTAMAFMLGIIAAAFSSADSALTALTTSFCVDILGLPSNKKSLKFNNTTRKLVHVGFCLLVFLVIVVFNELNDSSVVSAVFKAAGFTYGPILGLFAFGLLSKRETKDRWIPLVCVASPVLSYILDQHSEAWFYGYRFGFEILIVNASFTCLGLLLLSKKSEM